MSYLETTVKFYSEVAETPQVGLCCVNSPCNCQDSKFCQMQEMNYGCGTPSTTELWHPLSCT